jgi:hypothetical protein
MQPTQSVERHHRENLQVKLCFLFTSNFRPGAGVYDPGGADHQDSELSEGQQTFILILKRRAEEATNTDHATRRELAGVHGDEKNITAGQ